MGMQAIKASAQGTPQSHHGAASVLAYLLDDVTEDVLQQVIVERRLSGAIIRRGGIAAALSETGSTDYPEVMIVDVGANETAVADVSALAAACGGASRIIVLGDVNDVQLYRDLIGAGASEYLLKPVGRFQLIAALLESQPAQTQAKQAKKLGEQIVVLGARGGVGSTTAAISIAAGLSANAHKRVALVDLDLQFGTVALALNLGAGRGLREALEQPARIDSLFIERVMERINDNLFVLGAEEPLEEEIGVDLAAPSLLLHELRDRFDCVVIDLPRGAGMFQRQILSEAAKVVILAELSLPAVRDAIRWSGLVRDSAPTAQVMFAVVEKTAGKTAKISPGDFARSVGQPVAAILPWDAAAAALAAGQAKPVLTAARSTKLAAGYRTLVDVLAGPKPAKSAPIWKRLLRKT